MILPSDCPHTDGETSSGSESAAAPSSRGDAEASLCRCPGEEVYRFSWGGPYFDRALVSIARKGSEITLERFCSWYGKHPNPRPQRDARSLTTRDWERLHEALTMACFWTLSPTDDRHGFDGATWWFEGHREGVEHAIERWSPATEDPLYALGVVFFELAGCPFPEDHSAEGPHPMWP